MKTLDDILLEDILPENLAKDGTVKAASVAIDPQLTAVSQAVDLPSIYSNINSLSSLALDHLAVQYDVRVWRDTWPLSLKRSVLNTAIADKSKKGTLSAVKQALESLGSSAKVVEWWQETPKATPHTFKIYATQALIEGVIRSELQEDIIKAIYDAKPMRSHFTFTIQENIEGEFCAFGYLRVQAVGTVRSVDSNVVEANGAIGMTGAARAYNKRHLIGNA